MKKSLYTIKPLDNVHFLFLLPFVIFFVPFDLLLFTSAYEPILLIFVLIVNTIPILIFILARLFYNRKFVVENGFLIKYHMKKVIFKIKISDIEKVFVRKGRWYAFPHFVFDMVAYLMPKNCKISCVSFVFKRCEMLKIDKMEFDRPELKSSLYNAYFEQSEFFSYTKIKRLCSIINITPEIVA